MQYGIAIPTPCHEDWNAMTPDANGRHCAQCCKTVIDFTNWSADDIASYLATRQYDSVCGRFKEDQLTEITVTPETYIYELHRSAFSFLTKIAAVFVFVFCLTTSAEAQQQPINRAAPQLTMGKPARVEQGEVRQQPVQQHDPKVIPVKRPDPMIMGGIRAYPIHDTAHVKGRVHNTPSRKK